jgi:hypothetical protein
MLEGSHQNLLLSCGLRNTNVGLYGLRLIHNKLRGCIDSVTDRMGLRSMPLRLLDVDGIRTKFREDWCRHSDGTKLLRQKLERL